VTAFGAKADLANTHLKAEITKSKAEKHDKPNAEKLTC
jgi:hypothetical protein